MNAFFRTPVAARTSACVVQSAGARRLGQLGVQRGHLIQCPAERELRQVRHPAVDGEDPDVYAARVHGGYPGTVQGPGLPGGAPPQKVAQDVRVCVNHDGHCVLLMRNDQ